MVYKTIKIVNARIIDSHNDFRADIFIENGKISDISSNITLAAELEIDANGKYLLPGFVDPHVHFNLQTTYATSADDFHTGSLAAMAGGNVAFCDFVTPYHKQSLIEAFYNRLKEASNSLLPFKLHLSVIEWNENTESEITFLAQNKLINSIKVYMAYKNSIGINDDVLLKVLELAKKLDLVVLVHCENGDLISYLQQNYLKNGCVHPKYHCLSRPPVTEIDAVSRLINYNKFINAKIYIVHVSTKGAIELIAKAQKESMIVFAETCPHYLFFDKSVYENDDFYEAAKFVFSPPLREKIDVNSLLNAISNNLFTTIATDHCPFFLKGHKDLGLNDFTKIPNGIGSIELRNLLIYNLAVLGQLIDFRTFLNICSLNAAKIFDIKNVGDFEIGATRNFVLFDPNKKRIIKNECLYQNCDYNIYETFELYGSFDFVFISNGNSTKVYEFSICKNS